MMQLFHLLWWILFQTYVNCFFQSEVQSSFRCHTPLPKFCSRWCSYFVSQRLSDPKSSPPSPALLSNRKGWHISFPRRSRVAKNPATLGPIPEISCLRRRKGEVKFPMMRCECGGGISLSTEIVIWFHSAGHRSGPPRGR